MDILLLGGTRFLGRQLVEAALAKGHNVTLFNRGNHAEVFPDVELIKGDRNGDLSELAGRRWDSIIDTCGFMPDVVAKSAKFLNNSDHYTFISSISVYKDMSIPNMDENAEVLSLSADELQEVSQSNNIGEYYGHLKALCEKAAETEMPNRVFVVRPGLIVGPYDYTDRLPYWIKRITEGGEVLAPGRPERLIQMIDAKDLAEWIIQMVEKKMTGTYNAVGPNHKLTMEKLLQESKNVIQSEATFTWVNEDFLKEHEVGAWGEMPLWIPEEFPLPGEEKAWNGFLNMSNRKAIEMGLTSRPLSEIILDTYEWEKTRPQEKRLAGMDAEREKELLVLWKKEYVDQQRSSNIF